MKIPVVSVIIPVFNQGQYIRGAVESVLNQTFKDLEIIVVDDGSTDETFTMIEPWIKDGTIQYVHQANKGVSVARNVGIRLAKGGFLKFLDSDDFLYPQQLELQVQHLINKPNNYISISDSERVFEDKRPGYEEISLGKSSQLALFIQDNLAPLHAYLVRRSIIEEINGFDEELSSCEDTDLWLRIMTQGGVVEKLNYLGCYYRIVQGSLDSNSDRRLRNICKVFEKLNHALQLKLDKLPDDILESLLLKNTKLMYRCFNKNIKPVRYLPTALKVSQIIYAKRSNRLKNLILKIIGYQNIALLKYIKIYLTDQQYYKKMNVAIWRNEHKLK